MAEYIERGAAIKCAEESCKMWCLAMAAADGEREINKCYKMHDVCNAIGEVFKIVTAADVAPVVHARWYMRGGRACCSNCNVKSLWGSDWDGCKNHEREFVSAKSKYCPNCGAKMDEEG